MKYRTKQLDHATGNRKDWIRGNAIKRNTSIFVRYFIHNKISPILNSTTWDFIHVYINNISLYGTKSVCFPLPTTGLIHFRNRRSRVEIRSLLICYWDALTMQSWVLWFVCDALFVCNYYTFYARCIQLVHVFAHSFGAEKYYKGYTKNSNKKLQYKILYCDDENEFSEKDVIQT